MRIFVTGATGFIGSAIVKELTGAGHTVIGLARSEDSAAALAKAGAEAHRGSLGDLDSLRSGAKSADAVIHAAFIHDFSKFKENCEIERRAVAALGDALAGSRKPMIVTSGTLLVTGGLATEDRAAASTTNLRIASEEIAAEVAARGVRVSVLRLPPTVHGEGDHGFVPMLIGLARDKGISAYIGDGLNRWPAAHRLDIATLYRLILEKNDMAVRYHGAAEQGIAFKDIAAVIGKRLNVPVVGKTEDDAATHFGWFAHFAAGDNPTSSVQTRHQLGWQPKQPGLLADLDHEYYFRT